MTAVAVKHIRGAVVLHDRQNVHKHQHRDSGSQHQVARAFSFYFAGGAHVAAIHESFSLAPSYGISDKKSSAWGFRQRLRCRRAADPFVALSPASF